MEKSNDLEKIILEVARKDETETRDRGIVHEDCNYYYETLLKSKKTQFYLRPIWPRTSDFPLASTVGFLDFILDFDVSTRNSQPNPKLVKEYEGVRKKFIAECDKIHADDDVEIIYSKDLRRKHLTDECGEDVKCYPGVPLVYHPLGFETYTSSDTRKGQIIPEVTCVKVIDES